MGTRWPAWWRPQEWKLPERGVGESWRPRGAGAVKVGPWGRETRVSAAESGRGGVGGFGRGRKGGRRPFWKRASSWGGFERARALAPWVLLILVFGGYFLEAGDVWRLFEGWVPPRLEFDTYPFPIGTCMGLTSLLLSNVDLFSPLLF